MKKIIFTLFLISNTCFGQFKILVDETFSLKIQASIELIKQHDATSYVIVSDYCDEILISADSIPSSDDGTINIPLKVVGGPSLNLISSVVVRESYKLRLLDIAKHLNQKEIELLCHQYEIDFRKKLPKEYGSTWKEKIRKFIDKLRENSLSEDSEGEVAQ
jgi:hypothetical protein